MDQGVIRGIHVLPDGSSSVVYLKRDDWVREASGLIDGGFVEYANLNGEYTLLCDEDGLRKRLPMNYAATYFIQKLCGLWVELSGPVIITGPIKGAEQAPRSLDEHIGVGYTNEG